MLNLGSHELVVGRIVETFVSEDCLTEDRPDSVKMNPFFFANGNYYSLGEQKGSAFRVGNSINPTVKRDAT